jgi:flagellar hook protein FlgE
MAVNFSLTALTGINSASTGLGVISNNISNAQTIGFKSSRAEFADLFYGSQNSPGTGSRTQVVHQNFSQGAINDTGNALDLAVSGEGMFILSDVTGRYDAVYTRNGSFKLDKDGFVTDQVGNKLQGFSKDSKLSTPASSVYKTILEPMNIGNLNKLPKATSQTTFDLNLNGQDPVTYTTTASGGKQSASGVAFTADNLKDMSYNGAPNYSTSKVVYDSLGGQHRATVNYYKVGVNAPGAYPSSNASSGNAVNYTNETTDWYAQYVMEDFDPVTQTWYKSGSGADSAANATSNANAYTEYSTLMAVAGTTTTQASQSMSASSSFGVPTTPGGAASSAYNVALSLGASTAQAVDARNAAWTAAGGVGAYPNGGGATTSTLAQAQAAFGALTNTLSTAPATVLSAADKTRLDGTYNRYSVAATNWGNDSGRLADLFVVNDAAGNPMQPTNAAQAAQAAQAAATAMGLNGAQAAQAAQAAQTAYSNSAGADANAKSKDAFNAAFGVAATGNGVVTSIPDAVVQAYRFDSTGKLLDFNNNGDFAMIAGNTSAPMSVVAPQSWYFDVPNLNGTVGVTEAMTFDADLTKLTQYAGTYSIRGVTQDGYAAGDLVGVQVNKDGAIEARYSNGRSDVVAKLALANFSDQQGMQKLGSQMWAETAASGPRQLGNPQASGFGAVQAGALEYSNVDVTGELVNMIFMQKMYQASAQVISTDKTLTQTILQL